MEQEGDKDGLRPLSFPPSPEVRAQKPRDALWEGMTLDLALNLNTVWKKSSRENPGLFSSYLLQWLVSYNLESPGKSLNEGLSRSGGSVGISLGDCLY